MHPTNIKGANVILKGDASRDVADLAVKMRKYIGGTQTVTSEWKLTLRERLRVLIVGSVFVSVMTKDYPPIKLSAKDEE